MVPAPHSPAGSWECLQGGAVSSRPQSVVIDAAGSVTTTALASQTFSINGGEYVVPAQPSAAWTWANFNQSSSILQLRPVEAPASVQCFYFSATASSLTLVDVGGQAVTDNWGLQCESATYTNLGPAVATAPICQPQNNGTFSPELSTIVLAVGNGAPSGGATSGAEAAAAVLNTLAIALAALAGGSLVL